MIFNLLVKIRSCKSPGCDGHLVPVTVTSTGLGGDLSVCFGCDRCKSKLALFESFTRYEQGAAHRNDISMCVQVAFIGAGFTHAVYCKTLQNAQGMRAVHGAAFLQAACIQL